jgi:hypothetical protein
VHLREPGATGLFEPAPQVVEWIADTFLNEKSFLFDERHSHLARANIAALWTDVLNVTKMLPVIGTAEMPRPPQSGGKWARAKWEMQMGQWFGLEAPKIDFLITLYAPYAAEASDLEFCATAKHEICHCAQDVDEYEQPGFRKSDNRPVFAIREHDFGGFLSVVEYFGASAERNVPELVETVRKGPRISAVAIAGACGTCMLRIV